VREQQGRGDLTRVFIVSLPPRASKHAQPSLQLCLQSHLFPEVAIVTCRQQHKSMWDQFAWVSRISVAECKIERFADEVMLRSTTRR
jgi:hypothetical protein